MTEEPPPLVPSMGDEPGAAPLVPPMGDEPGAAPLVVPSIGDEPGMAPLVVPSIGDEPGMAPPVVLSIGDEPGAAPLGLPVPPVPPVLLGMLEVLPPDDWPLIVVESLPLVPDVLVPVARTSVGRPHPSSAAAARVAR